MSGKDHGSLHPNGSKSCTYWANKQRFATKPSAEGPPMSNLNLTALYGGKQWIPDGSYSEFLRRYADDIGAGSPQYLTECVGPKYFRLNFDLDYQGPTWTTDVYDRFATALAATTRRFLPSLKCSDETFKIIVCTAPPKPLDEGVKNGVHLIMPNCIVDREMMLSVLEVFKTELRSTFSDWDDIWDTVCDASVYAGPTSGLRMIGSQKMQNCTHCNGKKCSECMDTGKAPAGRPYKVERAYLGADFDAPYTQALQNFHLAVRHASIRVAAADPSQPRTPHPEWVKFSGCPTASVPAAKNLKSVVSGHLKDATERTQEFKDDKRGTKPFAQLGTSLAPQDPRIDIMLKALSRLHPNYAQCACREAFELPPHDATKQKTYLLKVKGVGSHFCINKQADHNQNSVYFIFNMDKDGSFHQRCFSRKQTTTGRIDGQCMCFQSEKKKLGRSEKEELWPEKKKPRV